MSVSVTGPDAAAAQPKTRPAPHTNPVLRRMRICPPYQRLTTCKATKRPTGEAFAGSYGIGIWPGNAAGIARNGGSLFVKFRTLDQIVSFCSQYWVGVAPVVYLRKTSPVIQEPTG